MKNIFLVCFLLISSFFKSQITEKVCGGVFSGVGTNTLAINAEVHPNSICIDLNNDLIISPKQGSSFQNIIRKINRQTGMITTIAGCSGNCANILGGVATSFSYIKPRCITVDNFGDIYFLDSYNSLGQRVYKIDHITNNITLFPNSIGIQTDFIKAFNGEIYYTSWNNQIFKLSQNGSQTLIAGTGTPGFSGDNGQAVDAKLNNPRDIVIDSSGIIYFIDYGNKRIRKIDNYVISTIAGNGVQSPSCTLCDPLQSSFQVLINLDIDIFGNLFFNDSYYLKKIDKCTGQLLTIGGNGANGPTISNVNPLQTSIYSGGYHGIAVDHLGYINFITLGMPVGNGIPDQIFRIKPQVAIDEIAGSNQYVCFGDSANLGYNSPNVSVNWSNNIVNNSNFFIDSSITLVLTVSNANGCVLFNDEVNIYSVPKPEINQVFDDYTCGIGYVKISANTNSVNSTIRWYSDSISGNSLFTGEQYTTPVLTADSSFYAEAYDTIYQCTSSSRELVNAYINPPNSCTYIPDNVFESKLIQQNIDDQLNDFVKTSKIDTLQMLIISSAGNPNKVYDLTGIQDFVHLKKFYALDNHLTNLDLSNNLELTYINVQNNFIEFFNASMLPNLCTLRIHDNALTCLNINNNNNQILTELISYDNPNLTCIKVDNHNWVVQMMQQTPPTHFWWVNGIFFNGGAQITQEFCGTNCDNAYQVFGCTDDNAINYNYLANYDDGSCQYLGVTEQTNINSKLFPNPSEDKIQISSQSYPYEYIIYSTNGVVMKKGCVNSEIDEIEILNLTPGFYIIENIELNEKMSFIKFR